MAAGNAIARGAVIISANADQMTAGLNAANHKLNSWGKSAGGSGLMSGLFKGAVLGAGMSLFNKIVEFPGKVIGKFDSMRESIDHAAKSARILGTDTATWQGIAHAASLSGVSIEQLETGMMRFRKNVDGPIDTALYKLADQLEAIQDPGERARLLVENFGKSGVQLANMFEGGAEGLKGMVAEAQKLGFAMSDIDAKKVEEANDAINRSHKALQGLWNRVVVALAPAFEKLANGMTELYIKAQPTFEFLGRAITSIVRVGEIAFDMFGKGWLAMLESLGAFGDKAMKVEDVVVEVFRHIGIGVSYLWDIIKAGAGVVALAAGAIVVGFGKVVEVFKDIVSLAKKLPDELRPAGLDRFIGGVDDFAAKVRDTGMDLARWGKGTFDHFGDSARRFNDELDAALAKTAKVDKAVKRSVAEIKTAPVWEPAKFSGAMEKGSKEAYSLEVANKFGSYMQPQKDKMEDLLKQGNKKTDKLIDKVDDVKKMLPVIFADPVCV